MSSSAPLLCEVDQRRAHVRTAKGPDGHPVVNGVDSLEVVSAEQTTLAVHFIHPLPGQPNAVPPAPAAPLKVEQVVVTGGVRIEGIRVLSATAKGTVLTLLVDRPGDFSPYRLRIVAEPGREDPPPGFDPQLASIEFSFKVDCPTELDCREVSACPPEAAPRPEIDYLAKDYAGFRRVMLDRLSLLVPGWKERTPADLGVTLVELLAYVADHLSYEQDAVATEAYFGTARRRVSVRRHARLVGYRPFDGCNARVWVQVQLLPGSDSVTLTASESNGPVRLLTNVPGKQPVLRHGSEAERDALATAPIVFELMQDATLFAAHARMTFYTWGNSRCCLPVGTRTATLRGQFPELRAGTVLMLVEEKGPVTGLPEDRDLAHRHVVRLVRDAVLGVDPLQGEPISHIEWHEEDALPFPLCLSAKTDAAHGEDEVTEVSVALGNMVLADHGRLLGAPEPLPAVPTSRLFRVPAMPAAGGPVSGASDTKTASDVTRAIPPRYRPALREQPLTHAAPAPYLDETVPRSARAAAAVARELVRPCMTSLTSRRHEVARAWTVVHDLLTDSVGQPHCVVEMEQDGTAFLRFGDGRYGARPEPESQFDVRYRVGNGTQGNIGADTLAHIVTDHPQIAGVANPMAAFGGMEPESLEDIRRNAPAAFQVQDRAVTLEDYAATTESEALVQRAAATLRWTGSWHTVFVTVDRMGGARVDQAYEAELSRRLEALRLAGQDVEIDDPRFVPIEGELRVTVAPGYLRSDVEAVLRDLFSSRLLPDGRRGLFHPDNFSFGQPVYLSPLYAAAQQVAGVRSVVLTKFHRMGQPESEALAQGLLPMGRLEIARLDNDPNFPDRGRFRLILEGGV